MTEQLNIDHVEPVAEDNETTVAELAAGFDPDPKVRQTAIQKLIAKEEKARADLAAKLAAKREKALAAALAKIEAVCDAKTEKANKVREEKVDQAYAQCEAKIKEAIDERVAAVAAVNEAFNVVHINDVCAAVANGHDFPEV